MMRLLRGAIQFLTVLPVRGPAAAPGRAAALFPLVGAALGYGGASLYLPLRTLLPAESAALLVLAFWMLLTGALHEDGLADVADAVRAHRPPDRILAILKDSRIGVFGALALILSVLLRWQALASIERDIVASLVMSQAVPRAVVVLLAYTTPPAGDGLGRWFASQLTGGVTAAAVAQGLLACLLRGPRFALFATGGSLLIVLLAREYFQRRLRGVTGDCLGAASQITEIYLLLLCAASI
jgi:adenosylcobinamide-GDP ribazoletransferase